MICPACKQYTPHLFSCKCGWELKHECRYCGVEMSELDWEDIIIKSIVEARDVSSKIGVGSSHRIRKRYIKLQDK